MNIYPLEGNLNTGEIDWEKSARSYDNYRLVSGTLQTSQLISTVFHKHGFKTIYNPYGLNHPNTLWVSESILNLHCMFTLSFTLFDEYNIRFGKIHKAKAIITDLSEYYQDISLPKTQITKYTSLVPDEYKNDNPIVACRNYIISKDKVKYPKNKIPQWFLDAREKTYEITR
jgi:hypothetical protein